MKSFLLLLGILIGIFGNFNTLKGGEKMNGHSILILGRTFYKGFPNIDPVLHAEFNAAGIQVGQGVYSEMNWEKIKQFKVIVFMAQPLPGTPEYDGFVKNIPLFDRFLKAGGGILIFRDKTSGGAGENAAINLFLHDKGGALTEGNKEGSFIQEADQHRIHWYDFVLRAYKTETINHEHPIGKNVNSIWFPMHTNAISVSEAWTIIVRASQTATFNHISAPPIMAAREFDKGRLVLLPSVSSYWTLEGYSPKWEGFILKNGEGKKLLFQTLEYLAGNASAEIGGFEERRQNEIFDMKRLEDFHWVKALPVSEQQNYGSYFKALIGPEVDRKKLPEFAKSARECGYQVVLLSVANKKEFDLVRAECEKISDNSFFMFPILAITDIRGNRAFAAGGAIAELPWPPKGWKEPSLLAAGVGAGAATIWRSSENRLWSPAAVGAVSAIETIRYNRKGEKKFHDLSDFRIYNSHDWFLAPVVINEIDEPQQLKKFRGFDNYIQAASLEEIKKSLQKGSNAGNAAFRNKPLSQRLYSAYIGNGKIRLHDFRWQGPGLTYDAWEGEYYHWFSSSEKANIILALEADSEITAVTLYRDNQPIKKYRNVGSKFSTSIIIPSDNSAHSYWVEAEDDRGGQAVSTVLRTRSAWFWAHGGADRMQTYANLFVESQTGSWKFHGKRLSFIPVTYFDLGWGNFMEKAMPPIASERFAVRGIETGGPKGGLSKYQLPPFLEFILEREGATKGVANDIGRKGYSLASRDAVVVKESGLRLLARKNGKLLEPIVPQNYQLQNTHTVYRFRPGTFEGLLMESCMKTTTRLESGEKIKFFEMNYKPYAREALKEIVYRRTADSKIVREPLVSGFRTEIGPGGFFALYHDRTSGNTGMYIFDNNHYTIEYNVKKPSLQMYIGSDGSPEMKSNVLLAYTACKENGDGRFFENIANDFSAEHQKSNFRIFRGTVKKFGYPITIDTKDHIAEFEFSPENKEQLYPISVTGVNPNWPVGWYDAQKAQLEILSAVDRQLPLVFDAEKMHRIIAGNLIIADHAELLIQLVEYQAATQNMTIVANNAGSKVISTTVRNNISGKEAVLALKPGEEKTIQL